MKDRYQGVRAKHKQQGITLVSVIIIGLLLVVCLIVVAKTIPVYNEYFAIQRAMGQVADEGNAGANPAQMRQSFVKFMIVESAIQTIDQDDLKFKKENGRVTVHVEYDRKIPLFSNISLLFEFNHTTGGNISGQGLTN